MSATKTEKGSGGKRGHSNQDNWMAHQEEKAVGKKQRRLHERQLLKDEQDFPSDDVVKQNGNGSTV
ncbi:MAG: hypothetical protein AB8B94_16715 [Hyphomicrobiales bacterium]